jgi:hypothetical protein
LLFFFRLLTVSPVQRYNEAASHFRTSSAKFFSKNFVRSSGLRFLRSALGEPDFRSRTRTRTRLKSKLLDVAEQPQRTSQHIPEKSPMLAHFVG